MSYPKKENLPQTLSGKLFPVFKIYFYIDGDKATFRFSKNMSSLVSNKSLAFGTYGSALLISFVERDPKIYNVVSSSGTFFVRVKVTKELLSLLPTTNTVFVLQPTTTEWFVLQFDKYQS